MGRIRSAQQALEMCYIYNLDDRQKLLFDHFPETVDESITANWEDVEILGRSVPIRTYSNSSGRSFSLTLNFSASMYQNDDGSYVGLEIKLAFLRALVYPEYGEIIRPAPKCILSIGQWLKMPCVISDLSISRKPPWDLQTMIATVAEVSMMCNEYADIPYGRSDITIGKDIGVGRRLISERG